MTSAVIRDANGSWVVRQPHEVRDDFALPPGTRVSITGTKGVFVVVDDSVDVEKRARLTSAIHAIMGS